MKDLTVCSESTSCSLKDSSYRIQKLINEKPENKNNKKMILPAVANGTTYKKKNTKCSVNSELFFQFSTLPSKNIQVLFAFFFWECFLRIKTSIIFTSILLRAKILACLKLKTVIYDSQLQKLHYVLTQEHNVFLFYPGLLRSILSAIQLYIEREKGRG